MNFSSPSSRPLLWLKTNLFNSAFNSLLTLGCLFLLYPLVLRPLHWAIAEAKWTVISANLRLFFAGQYPVEQLWRVWLGWEIGVSIAGLSWGMATPSQALGSRERWWVWGLALGAMLSTSPWVDAASRYWLCGSFAAMVAGVGVGRQFSRGANWLGAIWLAALFGIFWLLVGGLGLEAVPLDSLSGLILTVLVALASIGLSFPLGIVLALGRQSRLPVLRWLAIAYIELVRGLPLLGILFMAQVMLPLVLPMGVRVDRVVRAIAGFTLFSAAYLAENVRGGLQSIPQGQVEAAKALGLNAPLMMALVILPQALKVAIPSLVGQFISLFKNTSLLAIVGLVDLLGISQSILANPRYAGRYAEVYLFLALFYGLGCGMLSLASRKLEQKLKT
jgi:general L-amino acid transport system permease protein